VRSEHLEEMRLHERIRTSRSGTGIGKQLQERAAQDLEGYIAERATNAVSTLYLQHKRGRSSTPAYLSRRLLGCGVGKGAFTLQCGTNIPSLPQPGLCQPSGFEDLHRKLGQC